MAPPTLPARLAWVRKRRSPRRGSVAEERRAPRRGGPSRIEIFPAHVEVPPNVCRRSCEWLPPSTFQPLRRVG